MKALYISFAFLMTTVITIAQPYNIDSLKKQLLKTMPDSARVKVLRGITVAYQNYKPDSSLYYARQLISLAQKLKDKYHIAVGFNESAFGLAYLGDYATGLQMALNGKKIAGQLYNEGKPQRLVFAHLALGILDRHSGRYTSAIANFKESLKLVQASGLSEVDVYGFYGQMGAAYLGLGKLDSALYCAKKAYDLSLLATNKARLPLVYNTLGNVYEKVGNYQVAKSNYYLAIEKAKEFYFIFQLTRSYNDLATLFKNQGQQDSCIYYAQKSIELSNNYHYASYAVNGYNLLAQMYEMQSKPDSTLKYMKLMLSQKDSAFSQSKDQQYQQLIFNEEQRKQQEKNEQSEYRNRIKTYTLLSILSISLLIATILFRNNRQKQKANTKLQQQQTKTEQALYELKATQAQLIQSEKMASLGQLTAGIAHEIQNPLNFINNFSDVNAELIEEMEQEIDKGNKQEVKAIANDIKENEQKINHHGKRADAIVKGMLQHSRTSTGKKEPKDINALADEYLRLSYHGLRAKDKSFNARIETNFDERIGKIGVVPQDIGRVLLNLYNNAFYAVKDLEGLKNLQGLNSYEPTVSVSTKKLHDKIEISVKDNGMGIPQNVVDKIFQPFFTTKPTGQGTGLGLSMSYDIIKAHGGELKVETKEGEGAEFVVALPGEIKSG